VNFAVAVLVIGLLGHGFVEVDHVAVFDVKIALVTDHIVDVDKIGHDSSGIVGGTGSLEQQRVACVGDVKFAAVCTGTYADTPFFISPPAAFDVAVNVVYDCLSGLKQGVRFSMQAVLARRTEPKTVVRPKSGAIVVTRFSMTITPFFP
jgi:hypothetical protein